MKTFVMLILSILLQILLINQNTAASYIGKTPKCCPIGEVIERNPKTVFECTKLNRFNKVKKNKILNQFQTFCARPRFRIMVDDDIIESHESGKIIINQEELQPGTFCLDTFKNDLMMISCPDPPIVRKCHELDEILDGDTRSVPQPKEVIDLIWNIFTQKGVEIQYDRGFQCETKDKFCQTLKSDDMNNMKFTNAGSIMVGSLILKGNYCVDYKIDKNEGFYMCRCNVNDKWRYLIDELTEV